LPHGKKADKPSIAENILQKNIAKFKPIKRIAEKYFIQRLYMSQKWRM
jgi:hypothetical protein